MKIRVNLSNWTATMTGSIPTVDIVVPNLDGSLNFKKGHEFRCPQVSYHQLEEF